jgi:DNA-binding transcriptional LysR family regulator
VELDVRHLRLVAAVADTGGVAAAGRLLGTPAPTVIVQLGRIEAAVGRELFLRGSDGMHLTDAGRCLLRHARGVLDGIGRMAEEAARAEPGGVIRIVTTDPLDEVLPALHRRRPDDRVVVSRSTPEGCRAAVLEGAAHLALVLRYDGDAGTGDAADTGLVVRATPHRLLHLLVAATHPRAGDPLADLRELADDRWVAGTGRGDPVLRECRAAGVEPDVAFRVDDRGTARRLVADGLAVTVAVPGGEPVPGVVAVPYRGAGSAAWLVLSTVAPRDLVEDALAALRSAGPVHRGPGP